MRAAAPSMLRRRTSQHAGLQPALATSTPLHARRELAGVAVAEVQAQLLNLEMLRSTDARRNRHASAPVAEKANLFGGALEALVLAYALQAVPFGPDEPARKALVDTLRYQLKVRNRAAQWAGRAGMAGRRAGMVGRRAVLWAACKGLSGLLKQPIGITAQVPRCQQRAAPCKQPHHASTLLRGLPSAATHPLRPAVLRRTVSGHPTQLLTIASSNENSAAAAAAENLG